MAARQRLSVGRLPAGRLPAGRLRAGRLRLVSCRLVGCVLVGHLFVLPRAPEDNLAPVSAEIPREAEIVNDASARRWEARLDGRVVGYAEYRLSPGRVTFTHTVVQPEFEGHGIAGHLARAALDDAVANGLRIVPRCPYFRAYLGRHHEYDAHIDLPRT